MTFSPIWVSGFLWVAFILYWNGAARNVAPTISAESVRSRQVHQLLLLGSLVLLFLRVPLLDRRWLPVSPSIALVGLCVHAGAFLLAVWARRHLGRNWSAGVATKVDHQLVRTGPYRVIRHPIYSGVLGMFFGTALVSGEWHALIAFGVMSAAYWRKIRLEESRMGDVFGPQYEEYRRDSWALIPGVL